MVDVNEKSLEMEDGASFVEQELEALQSIYLNEIEVKYDEKLTSVSIELHPATADNHDEQYVRMTLKFILSEEYPQTVPEISIRNPRGLSEEKLNSIMQDMTSIAESKAGNSMLFEIIEAAKEHLTNENRPCGECAICLYGFSEDDVFTKTECYHYFHSHCLARYVKNASTSKSDDEANLSDTASEKKVLCPMCRLEIHFEGTEELYPPPLAKDDEVVIDEEVVALQKKMANLYQKQLEKGGIIDIEAEKNKYLLEISNAPTRVNTVEKSSPGSTVDDADSIPEVDSSSKTTENACEDSQSMPKNKTPRSKDSQNASRNKDKYDNRQRNDRYGYNKQPRNYANRGNYYRGNQRYNRYSKPNAQNFNRKSNESYGAEDLDYRNEHSYTEDENTSHQNKHRNVEDYSEDSHDMSPVSETSPGFRSSNQHRGNMRTNYNDSKKYNNERKGGDYRPYSNRGRRYGPNDYERGGYRGNRGSKGNSYKNDPANKEDTQNEEVTGNDVATPNSNIHGNSAESVNEQTTLTEKQDSKPKNYDKIQDNRPRNSNMHDRKSSYRNWDSEENYPEDNAQIQEGRKDSYRRGKPGRGYQNNYNDRQTYRENNYHSQSNRYSQENNQRRNFNQQSRQGDRHSQEKNSYNYEDRRDYNKNRSNDRTAHGSSNRKFSSDDRYDYHERENNTQVNIPKKSSFRNNREEQFDDEPNHMEKGNRYNGRNRNNSHYHNRDQNSRGYRDHRYDNNSSYQNNRNGDRQNTTRKYSDNSDNHYYKSDERTVPESQPSSEKFVNEKQYSTSVKEKVLAPKTDLSGSLPSEIPFKETKVPDLKTPASDTTHDVASKKAVQPPPGFSNPLKKVVYGLQAANPPPGFPRS